MCSPGCLVAAGDWLFPLLPLILMLIFSGPSES